MRKSLSNEFDLSDIEIEMVSTFRGFESIIKLLQKKEILYYPQNTENGIPDNGVIYVSKEGRLMVQGKEVLGRDKVLGLLALGKQKQTDSDTQVDDAILNLYCVVHKTNSSVASINSRLKKKGYKTFPPEFPGFNRIILLELAMNEWKRIRTEITEQESAILCGFISLYAHLNKFSPWLLSDEELDIDFSWDDWIKEHLDNSAGFQLGDTDVLKLEIKENNITLATQRVIAGLKILDCPTQSPPSASIRQQDPRSPETP